MRRDPELKRRSRKLRENANPVEELLWGYLRSRRLGGFKFRRQHVIGRYISDFYCAEVQLVVELDGESHRGKQQRDARRDRWLEQQGLQVLRFGNADVYENLEGVLDKILAVCQSWQF